MRTSYRDAGGPNRVIRSTRRRMSQRVRGPVALGIATALTIAELWGHPVARADDRLDIPRKGTRMVCSMQDSSTNRDGSFFSVFATFYGQRPTSPKTAEQVLRSCLEAARGTDGRHDMLGSAWFDEDQLDLPKGTLFLKYDAKSGSVAPFPPDKNPHSGKEVH